MQTHAYINPFLPLTYCSYSLASFAALDEARLLRVGLAQRLEVVALAHDLVVCTHGKGNRQVADNCGMVCDDNVPMIL